MKQYGLHHQRTERVNAQKLYISYMLKERKQEKGLSVRDIADLIENFSHPQFVRITKGENYNIDTLLKVLDVLGLEIDIKERTR